MAAPLLACISSSLKSPRNVLSEEVEQAGWQMLARFALVLTCRSETQVCPQENILPTSKAVSLSGIPKVGGVPGDRRLMGENNSFHQALKETDLDELVTRLGLYTHRRLAQMFWRGDSHGPIPGGWEVADFVQAAFRKGLTQERIWRSSQRSLFDFLKGIISSDINHLALKTENQIESRIADMRAEADRATRVIAELPGRGSDWPDADLRLKQEQEHILERVGDNQLDQNVVRCVLEHRLSVSADIAAKLNVPVNEVYKSKKRLRRKLRYLRTSSQDKSESAELSVRAASSRSGEKQNAKI